jgi:hypothetical protein
MTIPQDEFDAFVDDPATATRRWIEPVVGPLQVELTQLKRQRVQSAMDADPELGNRWRATNNDQAFIRWLGEADELSGSRRLELLRRAYDTGDSERVRHIFAAYLRPRAAATKTAAPGPFNPNVRQPSVRADAIGRRTYSRADIDKFYADKRAGLYDNREAEALRIERDIIAAAAGNRISDPPMKLSP